MKLISWNVNGIRAAVNKGFIEYFDSVDADFFCVQESKMQEGQLDLSMLDYYQFYNYAEKKGYSGTIVFAKRKPISVQYDIGIEEHSHEGRVITLEYKTFYLVCVYTPNAQDGLKRIAYRLRFENDFRNYLCQLKQHKSVIVCGDMNVAHTEIDLKNPKQNRGNAGFSDEEREAFDCLLRSGFVDSFRYLHPDAKEIYSWWSYRFNARSRNAGWRIDYFLVSDDLKEKIRKADIQMEIMGSDHCPVLLEIEELE